MKNLEKEFRRNKSILALFLLLFLATTVLASSSVRLVTADPVGIGKWIAVNIDPAGGGSVSVTKLSSLDTFESPYSQDFLLKVGAGDVKLEAFPNVGYEFVHWALSDGKFIDSSSYTFKTRQGTIEITAVFVENLFQVTAQVVGQDFGDIILEGVSANSFTIGVAGGSFSPDFSFIADSGYHVSAVSITGLNDQTTEFINPTSYEPFVVHQDYVINVYFSQDGFTFVPPGANVNTYFNENVGLHFDNYVGEGEYATGSPVPFPEGWAFFLWDIKAPIDDDKITTIVVAYDGTLPDDFHIYRSESLESLACDVNNDGKVDTRDLSLVANALKATQDINAHPYLPIYDTNRDGQLTEDDIHLVQDYRGDRFTELSFTNDAVNHLLYIYTDGFSIFRAR